jgi:hypothetical protein
VPVKTDTSDSHPPDCVIPDYVLIQFGPPDDEHLLLETCRGINKYIKKGCIKLVITQKNSKAEPWARHCTASCGLCHLTRKSNKLKVEPPLGTDCVRLSRVHCSFKWFHFTPLLWDYTLMNRTEQCYENEQFVFCVFASFVWLPEQSVIISQSNIIHLVCTVARNCLLSGTKTTFYISLRQT